MGLFDFNEQHTESTKMTQRSGRYSLKLTLLREFKHLPRISREPAGSGVSQLYLVLTPKGIEKGNYSDPESFFIIESGSDKYDWTDNVYVESWYKNRIKKIEFVHKDGTATVLTHKDDKGNCDYNNPGRYITIPMGKKNPVVEIIIH